MQKPARTAAQIPEKVGRYEILLPIASGGMATVYLARARGAGGFERDVALKLTHAHLKETSEFASGLLDEAMLAVRIKHPNVVPILDVDDDPLGLFLVMEYVEGDTLGGLRRRGPQQNLPLPRGVAMRILLDALAGLHAAHELRDDAGAPLDLVHRDFSPQNLLVGLDGVAKLTDFGIAKASSRLSETRTGLVKGKISYMAPEQARSQTLDRRCDVWAAGVIAWELLAERRLYAADNDVGTLLRVVSEEPPLLRTVARDIPVELERAVKHALTIDLNHRAVSAQAFARELTTACKAAGFLAEREEVAAYVAALVGQRLAERRGRAAEIVRLRSKIGRVVEASSSDAQSKRLEDRVAEVRGPLNQIPEPESSSSDVSSGIVDTASAESSAIAIPSAAGAVDRRTPEDLLDAVPRGVPARRDPKRVALVAAGVLVLGGIAVATFARPSSVVGVGANASASTHVPSSIGNAALRPGVEIPPVGEELPHAQLILRANAPLAVVHVDDRVVRTQSSNETTVDLTGEEHGRTLKLFALSTDGRQATTLAPAGATTATFEFRAPKDAPVTSPSPSVASTTAGAAVPKPPRPPTSQKPPTLAASPYGNKP